MRLVLSALILSVGLAGCSGNPPKPDENVKLDPNHSLGLNILRAGGVDYIHSFKDTEVDAEVYKKVMRSNDVGVAVGSSVAVGATAHAANMIFSAGAFDSGVFLKTFDLSGIATTAFLSSMLSPKHPMTRHHAVMWIPQSLAKDEKEARALIAKTVFDAIQKSLPNGVESVPYVYKSERRLQANFAPCLEEKEQEKLRYRNCSAADSPDKYPYDSMSEDIDFYLVKRPEFVAGDEPMAWVGYVDGSLVGMQYICNQHKVSKGSYKQCLTYNVDLLNNFLKNLPQWVYLYEMDYGIKLGMVKQGGTGNLYPLLKPKSKS
jgi:hypothetical protein